MRFFVACSKAYAISISLGSLHSVPAPTIGATEIASDVSEDELLKVLKPLGLER